MATFSQDDFLASLQACASKPGGARAEAYAALLDSLFSLPRSSLSAQALLSACSQYLELTVSDSQAPSGGLVASRNALVAFDDAVKRAAAAAKTNKKAKDSSDAMVDDDDDDDDPVTPAIADSEVQKDVLEVALDKLQPRVLVFEEQASALRLHLADVHESLEDWHAAASVLQGIPLDSGHRSVSDLAKLRIYVRIVRLLLEADDDVTADVYLKRASMVVHSVPGTNIGNTVTGGGSSSSSATDQGAAAQDASGSASGNGQPSTSSAAEDRKEGKLLGLQYKLCQARIYDAQRRFPEAAVRFHELSYVTDIDEEERTMMLSAAVTAGILAPAGPHRSRILSTLIRDDRTSSLPQATILSKVFLDQIVRPHEVAAFAELLQPHQKAQLSRTGNEREMLRLEEEAASSHDSAAGAEGSTSTSGAGAGTGTGATPLRSGPSTVLDRAMMEHNILASSRLYLSLTLRGLGSLLSLTPTGAETLVRRMIHQGRLRAEIDQVEGVLTFLHAPGDEVGSAAGGGGAEGDAAAGGEVGGGASSTAGAAGAGAGAGAGGAGVAAGGGDSSADGGAGAGAGAGPMAGGGAIDVTSEADQLTSLAAGDGLVRRWDAQIARTAGGLEEVCVRIGALRG